MSPDVDNRNDGRNTNPDDPYGPNQPPIPDPNPPVTNEEYSQPITVDGVRYRVRVIRTNSAKQLLAAFQMTTAPILFARTPSFEYYVGIPENKIRTYGWSNPNKTFVDTPVKAFVVEGTDGSVTYKDYTILCDVLEVKKWEVDNNVAGYDQMNDKYNPADGVDPVAVVPFVP